MIISLSWETTSSLKLPDIPYTKKAPSSLYLADVKRAHTDTHNLPPAASSKEVSLDDLRLGRLHAARLVKRYGSIYWPVVERLQFEISSRESRNVLLDEILEEGANRVASAKFG